MEGLTMDVGEQSPVDGKTLLRPFRVLLFRGKHLVTGFIEGINDGPFGTLF